MSNGVARHQRVVSRVRVGWMPARARGVQEQVERALRRRRAALRAGAVSFAAAACLSLVYYRGLLWPTTSVAAGAAAPSATVALQPRNLLTLEDGSVVDLLVADTVVETLETTASSTGLRVARGAAKFRVVRDVNRVFRVHAGNLTAEVIGTVFTVARTSDEARVSVESGRVRVSHNGGQSVLSDGDSVVVADNEVAASASPSISAAPDLAPAPVAAPAQPAWRELARAADYEQAYRSLERVGRSDVRDDPDDLLLAADVARLSRHSTEALPHLRAVVARHSRDPRAPLAAFTLGRVLLESLGRPLEAAAAFRAAQGLAPSGLLVEDALAREVEALSRAGDGASARTRAELYVHRYPHGRKLSSVRRHGGLD